MSGFNPVKDEILLARRAARELLAPEDRVLLDWRLIDAAKTGQTREQLIPALDRGANPDAIDGFKLTPLMYSTLGRFTAGVYALLEGGADPLAKSPVVLRAGTFVAVSSNNQVQKNDIWLTAPLMAVVTNETSTINAFRAASVIIPKAWHPAFRQFATIKTQYTIERLLELSP